MADVDTKAYQIATTRGLSEIETDDWLVERWAVEAYGGIIMAYTRNGDEWRASHYYRPTELRSEGTDATRHPKEDDWE